MPLKNACNKFGVRKLEVVPSKPGVYLWKNGFNQVIYVGKAKNLSSRMKQYFQGRTSSFKTSKLVSEIAGFDYLITNSEKEALILERRLIEKHNPKYNILLTDYKHYPYIRISLKKELKIFLAYEVKGVNDKNNVSYGPLPSGFGARNLCDFLNTIFKYERGLPIRNQSFGFWQTKFREAKKLMDAGFTNLQRELEARMWKAANQQQYELATAFKKTISHLAEFSGKSVVELNNHKNVDVIGVFERNNYLFFSLFFYRNGTLVLKKDYVQEVILSKPNTIGEFVNQYYKSNLLPNQIISNERFSAPVKLLVPQRGTMKRLVALAVTNAQDNVETKLQRFIQKQQITTNATKKLAKLLKLNSLNHILVVDNSHTNNAHPVSVVVSYRNGFQKHSESRKYIITNPKQKSDVYYLQEGLKKHFVLNKTNPFPNLLVVDGGLAQVKAAKKALPGFVRIIGLVKDANHKTSALIDLNERKTLVEDKFLFRFLQNIQTEVDRYAKSFHSFRKNKTLQGSLLSVEGLGPKTEEKLLNHFRNYSKIYNATLKELQEVVSRRLAELIKKKLGSF